MSRLDRFSLALGQHAAWLFVYATLITVYEVLMRYVFDAPTSWVHETTTALCALGFSFGGAYAMTRDEHVRITSVIDHVRPGLQRASRVLGLLCGAVYLGGLSWAATIQAHESLWRFEYGHWKPEAVPGPPHWPLPAVIRTALALGAALFLAVVLQRLWKELRTAKRP